MDQGDGKEGRRAWEGHKGRLPEKGSQWELLEKGMEGRGKEAKGQGRLHEQLKGKGSEKRWETRQRETTGARETMRTVGKDM